MAATAMFDTVDALVALIKALPEAQPELDVTVYDGFPLSSAANVVVAVGGTANPTVVLTSTTVTMGAQSVEETFEVEGTISSTIGSTDQKLARDNAKAVYEAVQAQLRSEMLPGGLKLGVTGLIYAEMVAVDLKQTDETDDLTGRAATITFRVKCAAWIPTT